MLPNLIIIGAAKAGTTSLHSYLNLHPDIAMAWEKELDFFVEDRNWKKGIRWYESKFRGKARIHGEASPNYTSYPIVTGVPERMHSVVPDAKLIYLVRDPVERIVSNYMMRFAAGKLNAPIREALADFESGSLVARSRYFMQLEQYLKFYPLERILVVVSEDLRDRRLDTLRRVFAFLGVDETFVSAKFEKTHHESRQRRRKNALGVRIAELPFMRLLKRLPRRAYFNVNQIIYAPFSSPVARPELDDDLRERLIAYLRPDVQQLRELTGYSFSGWSV